MFQAFCTQVLPLCEVVKMKMTYFVCIFMTFYICWQCGGKSSVNHPLKGEGRFLILAKVEPHCFSRSVLWCMNKNCMFLQRTIYLDTYYKDIVFLKIKTSYINTYIKFSVKKNKCNKQYLFLQPTSQNIFSSTTSIIISFKCGTYTI